MIKVEYLQIMENLIHQLTTLSEQTGVCNVEGYVCMGLCFIAEALVDLDLWRFLGCMTIKLAFANNFKILILDMTSLSIKTSCFGYRSEGCGVAVDSCKINRGRSQRTLGCRTINMESFQKIWTLMLEVTSLSALKEDLSGATMDVELSLIQARLVEVNLEGLLDA